MLRDARSQNHNKKETILGKVFVSIAGSVWHRSEITQSVRCGATTPRQFSNWKGWHSSSNRCDSIHARRKHNKNDLFSSSSILDAQTQIRSELVMTPWCARACVYDLSNSNDFRLFLTFVRFRIGQYKRPFGMLTVPIYWMRGGRFSTSTLPLIPVSFLRSPSANFAQLIQLYHSRWQIRNGTWRASKRVRSRTSLHFDHGAWCHWRRFLRKTAKKHLNDSQFESNTTIDSHRLFDQR